MSLNSIITRKLSWGGCRLVGTQLSARLQALSQQNLNLTPDVLLSAKQVVEKTKAFDQLSGKTSNVRQIDNGADQFIGAYHRSFEDRELCFTYESLVEISQEDAQHLELLRKARLALFPKGIKWVTDNVVDQWNRLYEIQQKIQTTPELQKTLDRLGLTVETSRFLRWIDCYGEAVKPGSNTSYQLAQLVQEFHAAWEDFSIEVRHSYKGATHAALRTQLLGDFDTQLAREQEASRLAREKQSLADEDDLDPVQDQNLQ
jgi:hypothetical protein